MPRFSIYCKYTLPVTAVFTVEAKTKAEARRLFHSDKWLEVCRDENAADTGPASKKSIVNIKIDGFGENK